MHGSIRSILELILPIFFCRLSSNFYRQHSGKPAPTYKKDYKTNTQAKAKNLKLTTPSPWRQRQLQIETSKQNKPEAKEIQQKPIYAATACKEYKSSLLRPTIRLPEIQQNILSQGGHTKFL